MRKFLLGGLVPMNLQLFAEDGGSGGGSSSGNGAGDGAAGSSSGEGGAGDSGQQNPPKTFSQDDVDKMMKDRLAKENKKFQKQLDDLKKQFSAGGDGEGNANAGGQQGDGQQGTGVTEESIKAQALITAANQRLVQATAVTEAVKLGVDPKYTADVVKLADLSKIEVKEDGTLDAGAISKQLDEVLKRMPMFKMTQNNAGGFRVGGEGQQPPNSNGWNHNQQGQGTPKPWNRMNR